MVEQSRTTTVARPTIVAMLKRQRAPLAPVSPTRISPDIAKRLTDIDASVEAVNQASVDGSDIETLSYAIHNIIACIRDIDDNN